MNAEAFVIIDNARKWDEHQANLRAAKARQQQGANGDGRAPLATTRGGGSTNNVPKELARERDAKAALKKTGSVDAAVNAIAAQRERRLAEARRKGNRSR